MTYILANDGTLQKDEREMLTRNSSKRDLFDALCIQVNRAEAAEARAAELERQLSAEQAAHKSDVEALRIELRLAYDAYHRAVHP